MDYGSSAAVQITHASCSRCVTGVMAGDAFCVGIGWNGLAILRGDAIGKLFELCSTGQPRAAVPTCCEEETDSE